MMSETEYPSWVATTLLSPEIPIIGTTQTMGPPHEEEEGHQEEPGVQAQGQDTGEHQLPLVPREESGCSGTPR